MRIAQINGTYGHGDSTGGTTKEMSDWLIHKDHSVLVFSSIANNGYENEEFVCCYASRFGRFYHGVMSRLRGKQGFYSKRDTKKLLKHLETYFPDIVILRVLHNNSINLPMLFLWLKKRRVPFVLVLHDCWYYTGHCCYYVQYPCDKWLRGCKQCEHMRDWNPSWIFDTASKCLAMKQSWYKDAYRYAVIGVSDWVTEDAKKTVLGGAEVIKRIYNWINLEIFQPLGNSREIRDRHRIAPDQKIIFAASTGWPDNKGYREVMAVSDLLKDAVLIIAGAIEAGRRDNIILLGHLSNPKLLAEYYSAADVFINPSQYETFGKTTAEALSCGTPVVAYDTTGSSELVNDERGRLVEYSYDGGMEKRISKYVDAVENVLKMGKENYETNCREFAVSNFSIDNNMEEYMRIFLKLSERRVE